MSHLLPHTLSFSFFLYVLCASSSQYPSFPSELRFRTSNVFPHTFHIRAFLDLLMRVTTGITRKHYILFKVLPDMKTLVICIFIYACSLTQHTLSPILTPLLFSVAPNTSAGSSLTINSPSSMSLVATQPNPRPANDSSLYMFMGKDALVKVEICPKLCVSSIFVIQSCDDAVLRCCCDDWCSGIQSQVVCKLNG